MWSWDYTTSCWLLLLSRFSHVRLCVTPEMAAHQAPPSPGFSRQEHWSGLPFPSPMHESEKWKWSHSVVSDSSRLHGLQPTGLLHPWDFPGKTTGVGCHCLLRLYLAVGVIKTPRGQETWPIKANEPGMGRARVWSQTSKVLSEAFSYFLHSLVFGPGWVFFFFFFFTLNIYGFCLWIFSLIMML